MEVWKPINGFNNAYSVSNKGRVRSNDREVVNKLGIKRNIKGHIISQTIVNSGYNQVALYVNGNTYRKYVHQLVAEAFLENPRGLPEVNHKDYNKHNNCVNNLEWCTHIENIMDLRNKKYGGYKDSHNKCNTHKCIDCGKPIAYGSTRCIKCASVYYAKNHYRQISKDDLIKSLVTSNGNFVKAAKDYGITDNALRKWCRKYDLSAR